ncbi:uncharacterized protein LOC116256992 [Nymphaea colorata]|uniref:Uncharacterized protein n=1 Tax=Nymphaea colorata TaxID=210225 RepID=A0A5K1ESM9_9MAGN|nr:uncharacterized protein LOC116256992 [Nymphaea colorata]XP_049934539.1 uncharacterized protein LOC116256992 [Nymphaea colorata]VVW53994.1 unnamed protein product [Nymphaea colorata]
MALEIVSDNSGWTFSPRISFSSDLSQTDRIGDHREDSSLLQSSSCDFHFCIPEQNYSSPADQLFYNGKILPLAAISAPLASVPPRSSRSGSLKEILDSEKQPTPAPAASKSFWGFRRSNSLNCRSITKSGLLSSLNKMTRSKSMGSNTKEATLPAKKAAAPPPALLSANPIKAGKKPPLKKKEHNNGVRINPVLNVPPPYISRGRSSLFSFGYFLCRKEKNRKAF